MDVQIGKYKMGDFGLKLLGVDLGTPSVRKSTVIPKGHSTVPDILITEGIHTMQFKGDGGTVSVEYRGGRF